MNIIKAVRTAFLLAAVTPATLFAQMPSFSTERQTNYMGHTYVLVSEPLNHENGVLVAASLGGYLAIPNDNQEQSFLASFSGNTSFWLGLHRERPGYYNKTFLRDTDNQPATYTCWLPGEPNNGSYIDSNGIEHHNPAQYSPTGVVSDEKLVVGDSRGWNDVEVPDSYFPPGTPYLQKTIVEIDLPPQNPPFSDGLVAFYPFNGNANDESGNGNNLAASNIAYPSSDNWQSSPAALFNGYSSEAFGTNSFIANKNEWTWSGWVNLALAGSLDDWQYLYAEGSSAIFGIGVHLGTGMIRIDSWNSQHLPDSWLQALAPCQDIIGNWRHFVFTLEDGKVDSGTLKCYMDGRLFSTNNLQIAELPAYDMPKVSISNWSHDLGVPTHFDGMMDNVRIYNHALSELEIADLHAYESPEQPWLTMNVKTVQVTMHVKPTKKYQLEASLDMKSWAKTGDAFVASTSEINQEFNAIEVGRFFRLSEVQ
jgi:hypothetical protein